eukprot:5405260-Pyramimonas_sp.AAC.1
MKLPICPQAAMTRQGQQDLKSLKSQVLMFVGDKSPFRDESLDMNTGTASHGALIMVRPRLYFQMHVSIIVMLICQSFPIVELRRPVELSYALHLTCLTNFNTTAHPPTFKQIDGAGTVTTEERPQEMISPIDLFLQRLGQQGFGV